MPPTDPDAIHLQAYLEYSVGDFAEAARLLRSAIEARPRQATYHFDLGLTQWHQGDYAAAKAAFLEAARCDIDFSDAVYNAGLAARKCGALAEAKQLIQRSRKSAPLLLLRQIRDRARESIRSVVQPLENNGWRIPTRDFPAVRFSIAHAFHRLGEFERSAREMERAIALEPTAARHSALGATLAQLGQLKAAKKHLESALALDATNPDTHESLAQVLEGAGEFDGARREHEKALELRPDDVAILVQLLTLDSKEGRFEEGKARYERLVGAIDRRRLGDTAWDHLTPILYRAIMWPLPLQKLKAVEREVDEQLRRKAEHRTLRPATARPLTPDRRIRVGYLSANLRDHPIGHVTADLFKAHDRRKFEIHVLHGSAQSSSHTRSAKKHVDYFHQLTGKVSEVTSYIRDLELDLLIYLDGYMHHWLLQVVSGRPAVRQAYWLGHAGHCAVSSIDYFITDRIVLPPDEEDAYRVKIVRLPETYHCATREKIGPPITRKKAGLPETGFVFCAFNNPEKIDAAIFSAWMRILSQVPDSVLWLSRGPSAQFETAMRARAEAAGVAASRLVFAKRLPDKSVHLSRHRLAGLFLDTLSLTASTTALDALWAGLPIITVHGATYGARIASSMLRAVGMEDMICNSLEAYEREAVRLASTPEALAEKRERLMRNKETHPLFDARRFAGHLEAAIEGICQDPAPRT